MITVPANHRWYIGLDPNFESWVAKPGCYFVSTWGSDIEGTGSPTQPWRSITHAINAVGTSANEVTGTFPQLAWGVKIVIAGGYYAEPANPDITSDNVLLWANIDNTVTFHCTDSSLGTIAGLAGDMNIWTEGLNNIGYIGLNILDTVFGPDIRFGGIYYNCILINSRENANDPGERMALINSIMINSRVNISGASTARSALLSGCTLIGSAFSANVRPDSDSSFYIENCDIDAGSYVFMDDDWPASVNSKIFFKNSNVRINSFQNGVPFSDYPDRIIFDNVTDIDPIFIGDPDKLQLLIAQGSPLISGSGTIGAMDTGSVVDLGTAALENMDINGNGALIIIDEALDGAITPDITSFSRVRCAPIVSTNGITTGLGLLPDQVITIGHSSVQSGALLLEPFVLGLPMLRDNSGRPTGNSLFNPYDIASDGNINLSNAANWDVVTEDNLVKVLRIQPRFTYIQAA